jgi:hypothetical protein
MKVMVLILSYAHLPLPTLLSLGSLSQILH